MKKNNRHLFWVLLFNTTFFIGYFFRLVNFGWLMFLLAIPEYVLRSFYYVAGMYILKKNIEKHNIAQITLLQCLYLLTSFFSYDGGDASSYTFAHLWINPPESLIMPLWSATAVLTITMLMVFFINNLKQHSPFTVSIPWLFKYITLGCILTPALTILLILLPSITRTI